MRRLRDSPVNLTRRGGGARSRAALRPALVVLALLSVGLLLLGRLDHPGIREARWRISEWLTPLSTAAVGPLEPVRWAGRQLAEYAAMGDELARLRAANRRLEAAEGRAQELERQVVELSRLARVVADLAIPFVGARVVATSSGAFVRTASINAGRENEVASGYPVVDGDGLVGRVVETGRNAARVLLLTDHNSRVPVHVGKAAVRAILGGDNGTRPRLEFLPDGASLVAGDEVVTSGVGGLFPRSLRIGRVVRDGSAWRVELFADLDRLEFVSVIRHPSPLLEIDGDGSAGGAGAGDRRGARPVAGARSPDGAERMP